MHRFASRFQHFPGRHAPEPRYNWLTFRLFDFHSIPPLLLTSPFCSSFFPRYRYWQQSTAPDQPCRPMMRTAGEMPLWTWRLMTMSWRSSMWAPCRISASTSPASRSPTASTATCREHWTPGQSGYRGVSQESQERLSALSMFLL